MTPDPKKWTVWSRGYRDYVRGVPCLESVHDTEEAAMAMRDSLMKDSPAEFWYEFPVDHSVIESTQIKR